MLQSLKEREIPKDQGDEEWLLEGASRDFNGLFPAGMSRWSFMVESDLLF